MSVRPELTVLATNDFLASVEPWPTSYGQLPGALALRELVDHERASKPCIWVDAGDFAQGGPLATETNGEGGFAAFAELAPDVAVVGNHEFDWGVQHLLDHEQKLGFPLLCANRMIGLPATAVFSVGEMAVGVVGLTHPELADLAHAAGEPDRTLEDALRDGLRAIEGVDVTIVAIHNGVRPDSKGDSAVDVPQWWKPIEGQLKRADLVVCGHTLGRFIGRIGPTPVLQPWAFGAEIGVATIGRDGVIPGSRTPDPAGRRPDQSEVIGRSQRTMLNAPGRESSLQDFLAEAIRAHSGADVGVIPGASLVMQQPPIDGVLGYLPRGDVSRALVQRLVPWTDDSLVVTQLTKQQLDVIRSIVGSAGYGDCGLAGSESARGRTSHITVCLSSYLHEGAQAWLSTALDAEPVDAGLREIFTNELEIAA